MENTTDNTVASTEVQDTTQTAGTVETPTAQISPEQKEAINAEASNANEDNADDTVETSKSFSEEQVNDIVKTRLGKLYDKYGAADSDELDKMIGESQAYEVTKQENIELSAQIAELKTSIALINSGVDKSRYEDVKSILKGKNLDINEENIKNELNTHSEWLGNVASIQVGSVKSESKEPAKDDKDLAEEAFGVKFID